ncbi:MAG: EamA family transporter [Rudaea sp.]|uniref:DMT family transporter n=1 Tax=unclassified Rudaea TaxID=2627037 RepID=UPI0010F7F0BB|nr:MULTISPECIES: EamA family transporter [unclassified Rudaea]MBN8887894.1 EamA family transporter [Rudaea sp.]MBR0347345.1 EamA family transporter [Rudaea sp.]
MRRFYLIGFLVLMTFDTLTQVCFKLNANHAGPFVADFAWVVRVVSAPWMYVAIAGYIGSFFTWMTLLKHAPVGPAFAASHLEVVVVLVLSYFIFGDHLSLVQLFGSAVIVAGIVCLAFDPPDEGHDERPSG